MFQFRRFPTYTYLIQCTLHGYCPCGFPHSEIHGSKDICSSPWLIAAYRVLLRLSVPRHSPCALFSLTNRKQNHFCSLYCWIMQAIKDCCWNCNCFYPHLFRCFVPQLLFYASYILQYKNLSVALLTFINTMFSFQGAASAQKQIRFRWFCLGAGLFHFSQPLLKPDWNTRFLQVFQSILKNGGE